MYFLALRDDFFPRNGFLDALLKLALACLLLGVVQYLLLDLPIAVLVYGYRTAFLHLPLVFLIPELFTLEDLKRVGRWLLVLAIPMALLMAIQFESTADAWINRAPGLGGGLTLRRLTG